MNIHIYYRHYNVQGNDNKNRPNWFNFENCYRSLTSSLIDYKGTNNLNTRINVIFDGKYDDNNWIEDKEFDSIRYIKAGGDASSFFQTCEIIKNDNNIKENDLIYFLENDYMHVKGWEYKIKELFKTYKGLTYVSLYDHKDKYFLPQYESLVSKIIITNLHHWRTTPSTCGSFIISKQIFDEDYDILSTMEGDHNKFLWLNENKNRSVITPVPGLSTHCVKGLLSPTIKWLNEFR